MAQWTGIIKKSGRRSRVSLIENHFNQTTIIMNHDIDINTSTVRITTKAFYFVGEHLTGTRAEVRNFIQNKASYHNKKQLSNIRSPPWGIEVRLLISFKLFGQMENGRDFVHLLLRHAVGGETH